MFKVMHIDNHQVFFYQMSIHEMPKLGMQKWIAALERTRTTHPLSSTDVQDMLKQCI